eukprot:CAMPEP_0197658170 /NCGR_PEP_ID=MMETSP1338-20131121/45074_1 /TAXON_ID=43686 ORGANISM="Pelagodinium beii, Strain RCC1491" /NCGR_SAMPLE_ID=MMETSP1338 /ASSEMBLY_ACC=CAM_ASM_000754 /LENGTH=596 /DNA_ID=CAMNT_0043234709 /DNA_START=33 /DNA_END=1820 /DNA_ORIENTATION=+
MVFQIAAGHSGPGHNFLGALSTESALESDGDYPLELGVAYLLLAGYGFRTLFVSFSLPGAVGVLLSGFAFSYVFQYKLLAARDDLQELAFFLVLLIAGLEIRLKDLNAYIFIMAILPATLEMLAVAAYAVFFMNFSAIEGLVLGNILFAIGDGLVIPKMKEFGATFHGHPMPRLMFIWAPLEVSYALAMFGVLSGFAVPSDQKQSLRQVSILVSGNVLRIIFTVIGGAFIGHLSGKFLENRRNVTIGGKQVFNGTSVEAFLIVTSAALISYALGASCDKSDNPLLPLGFSTGSLFQSELFVIFTGVFFANACGKEALHEIEAVLGGVWVFGQLILFSMIGSRTTVDIFPEFIPHVLPVLSFGLAFRYFGILIGINLSMFLKLQGHPFSPEFVMQDSCFCFLATLPRATIQGALGQVPITESFFKNSLPTRAQNFIFLAARLYIVFLSVFGMILLNFFGPRMCLATQHRQPWDELVKASDEASEDEPQSTESSENELSVEYLLQAIGEVYDLSPETVAAALKKASDPEDQSKDKKQRFHQRASTFAHPSMERRLSDLTGFRHRHSESGQLSHDLDLAQFDCSGSTFNKAQHDDEGEW